MDNIEAVAPPVHMRRFLLHLFTLHMIELRFQIRRVCQRIADESVHFFKSTHRRSKKMSQFVSFEDNIGVALHLRFLRLHTTSALGFLTIKISNVEKLGLVSTKLLLACLQLRISARERVFESGDVQ